MRTYLYKLSLLVLFFVISNIVFATTCCALPEDITKAINTGDYKTLSKYFNTTIELVLPDIDDSYSKAQAEQIIKNFFSKNMPSKFMILHEGGKTGSKFTIGNITTSKGIFRVYILMKGAIIHQLRFEEDG